MPNSAIEHLGCAASKRLSSVRLVLENSCAHLLANFAQITAARLSFSSARIRFCAKNLLVEILSVTRLEWLAHRHLESSLPAFAPLCPKEHRTCRHAVI